MASKIGLSFCLELNWLSMVSGRARLGAGLSAIQHGPRSRRCLGASILKVFISTMGCKPPARVRDSLVDIDTPALIIKLNELERNIRHLPTTLRDAAGVAVRPHAKAHKCPVIGQLQVKHGGAIGLCCQKLSEAEAMAEGGISDIFISNEVIGSRKIARLTALAKLSNLSLCVDNEENIRNISDTASQLNVNIGMVVELNVGQDRCGVETAEEVLSLANLIIGLPGVTFKGIQAYQGWNQHVRNHTERQAAVEKVANKAKKTVELLKQNNVGCDIVTGGGTGTYLFEAKSGIFTEVQPGSYVFMDADYGKNYDQDGNFFKEFENSLFVLSTVISVTKGKRAILDAGMKAVSLDSGPPVVCDHEGTYYGGGDEHGIVKPPGNLKVGDRVLLIPGHCDPTVNLYDYFVGLRDNKVECIWPITARGPGI